MSKAAHPCTTPAPAEPSPGHSEPWMPSLITSWLLREPGHPMQKWADDVVHKRVDQPQKQVFMHASCTRLTSVRCLDYHHKSHIALFSHISLLIRQDLAPTDDQPPTQSSTLPPYLPETKPFSNPFTNRILSALFKHFTRDAQSLSSNTKDHKSCYYTTKTTKDFIDTVPDIWTDWTFWEITRLNWVPRAR